MKNKFIKKMLCVLIIAIFSITITSCSNSNNNGGFTPDGPGDLNQDRPSGPSGFDPSDSTTNGSEEEPISSNDLLDEITRLNKENNNIEITCSSGSDNCYKIEGETITFTGISEDTVYSIKGSFVGNIIIDVSEDYEFELELSGLTLESDNTSPIKVISAKKASISAKKGTINNINDFRNLITNENEIDDAIYAACDLNLKGKGTLIVYSLYNKGIHSKDDLKIKNLTLKVNAYDNAVKGNDSIRIGSGDLTIISRTKDALKTKNSNISSKGNQKGDITITGGNINIYASEDGISASHDVIINEKDSDLLLNIYTDIYSKYTTVDTSSEQTYYLKTTNKSYKYYVKFFNSTTDYTLVEATYFTSKSVSNNTYYCYKLTRPANYNNLQVYMYLENQESITNENYYAISLSYKVNTTYDTLALNLNENKEITFMWTKYNQTSTKPGGGFGEREEGNQNKKDYSSKGIKSNNEILITSGTLNINSYDDAIHTSNDNTLENGETPTGNISITSSTITINTKDDAIHADGSLTINSGTIKVLSSYEGLEGNKVIINDGNISIISSDDGINGVSTSGEAIVINGGNLYIYASGDGLDSNSTSSYDGILISGGKIVVISNGKSDSSIDTERGYKYTGGLVIAVGNAGGMSSEALNVNNFKQIGTSTTINSLSRNSYLEINVDNETYVLKLPCEFNNAQVIYLGSNSAVISKVSTTNKTLDENGVYFG